MDSQCGIGAPVIVVFLAAMTASNEEQTLDAGARRLLR